MVPCVVYCGNALKWNVSYTTPWPENAASPWIRTLITFAYKYIVRVNKLVIDDNGKPAWQGCHGYLPHFHIWLPLFDQETSHTHLSMMASNLILEGTCVYVYCLCLLIFLPFTYK